MLYDETSSHRTEHGYWKLDYGLTIYPQSMRGQGDLKQRRHPVAIRAEVFLIPFDGFETV